MSEAVIRADNLSKRYVLRHAAQKGSYATLRESLAGGAKALGRRLSRRRGEDSPAREEFWALKDVSFAVKRGGVVGVDLFEGCVVIDSVTAQHN